LTGSAASGVEGKFTTGHHRPRAGHHLGAVRHRSPNRRTDMKKRGILSALAVTSVRALSTCGGGGGNPLSGGENSGGSEGSQVIFSSAAFTESQLIGSIYSQALQAAGVK